MKAETLTVQKRTETGRAARKAAGKRIPAVLYGHNVSSLKVWVDTTVFMRVFEDVGESGVIQLTVDEAKKAVPVAIRDVQRDPLSHNIIHIDFYQVKMSEEMTADVPVVFTGEAPAVKESGGTLIHSIDTLPVKCLPKDLPHEISVDISGLKTFEDRISVGDLPKLPGVTYMLEPDVAIASVAAPRVEKEEPTVTEETVSTEEETEKQVKEEKE